MCQVLVVLYNGEPRVHASSLFGTITYRGMLLLVPEFTIVRNLVNLLACDVWAMEWLALLCLAILSPLMCWLVHVDRRCDHVSLSLH